MIDIVFCDMDNVLVDFNKAACKIIGVQYPPSKWHWYEDIPNGFEQVNKACTIDFWKNLEWMHDGRDILRAILDKFHPEQIYLLTAPMPNIESPTGKWMWVEKNLPVYLNRTIITQAPKSLLARPNTLLIDDKDENVEEFIKANGNAILVPRPWNELRGWANETYQIVKNSLELC